MIEFGEKYTIPFSSKLKVADKTLSFKEVIPFRFTKEDQDYHFELSVLPGLHKESLMQAKEALSEFLFTGDKDTTLLPPSALFAFEGALWLKNIENYKIKINGLYIPESEKNLAPCEVLKVKIGRIDFDKEIELINHLTDNHFTLRLDANGSLSRELLLRYWEKIKLKKNIEYFEEPLKDNEELFKLSENIPIALDESCEKFLNEKLPDYITTFVIKPSVYFGLNNTLSIINKTPKQVVISSAFETPMQLITLMKLANYRPKTHHGLDTIKYFVFNETPNYLNHEKGQIIFHEKNFKL